MNLCFLGSDHDLLRSSLDLIWQSFYLQIWFLRRTQVWMNENASLIIPNANILEQSRYKQQKSGNCKIGRNLPPLKRGIHFQKKRNLSPFPVTITPLLPARFSTSIFPARFLFHPRIRRWPSFPENGNGRQLWRKLLLRIGTEVCTLISIKKCIQQKENDVQITFPCPDLPPSSPSPDICPHSTSGPPRGPCTLSPGSYSCPCNKKMFVTCRLFEILSHYL